MKLFLSGCYSNFKNLINANKNIKIIKFLSILRKEHLFLFLALICSFILSIIPCLDCLFNFFEDKYIGLIFFIPSIIVLLVIIIATKTHKYYPKLTNTITFLLNSFIIIIVQIFISIFIWSFLTISNDYYMHDKPEYYEKVLSYFPNEYIVHFPKHIPNFASNVEMNADFFSFQGGQSIALKFDTNKNYINNELKKYRFKSQETPQHYVFSTMNGNINIEDFIFFVIDGNLDRFGKNYGIGVNKSFNSIIYYYSNPD